MRTKTTSLLFAALAATIALAPLAAQAGPHRDPELKSLRQQLHAAKLVRALELDDAQRTQLIALIEKARAEREAARATPAMAQAKAALKAALQGAVSDAREEGEISPESKAALKAAREQMKAAHGDMKTAAKAFHEQARAILRPEQLKRVRAMMGPPGPHGMQGKGDAKGAHGPRCADCKKGEHSACAHKDGKKGEHGACAHKDGKKGEHGACAHKDGKKGEHGACAHKGGKKGEHGACAHKGGKKGEHGACAHKGKRAGHGMRGHHGRGPGRGLGQLILSDAFLAELKR